MQIYHYHSATGEYLGQSVADESPLEPGVFLVPACATREAPPAAIAGHVWCWREDAWDAMEDHRGERLWDASGAEVAVRELGPLPEGLSADQPEPTEADLAALARAKRDAALTACEWLVIRHRDQVDAGMATTLTTAQYAELLAYRQALRDWPALSGWPDVDLPSAPGWLE